MTNPGPWTAPNQPVQPRSRRGWWIAGGIVAAVLVVVVAFLAGLGWDDAVADENEKDGPTVAEIAAGLRACDNHDRMCHATNNLTVRRIANAIGDGASPELEAGVADFDTQFRAFVDGGCGINMQNVVCGLKGLNLNLAITSIKRVVSTG